MEIGDPIRTYTIEPIEDPVPADPLCSHRSGRLGRRSKRLAHFKASP